MKGGVGAFKPPTIQRVTPAQILGPVDMNQQSMSSIQFDTSFQSQDMSFINKKVRIVGNRSTRTVAQVDPIQERKREFHQQQEIESLKLELGDSERKVSNLEMEVEKKKSEIESLKIQLTTVKTELEHERLKHSDDTKTQSEEIADALEKKLASLLASNRELSSQIQHEISSSEKKQSPHNSPLKSENENLKSQIETLKEKI